MLADKISWEQFEVCNVDIRGIEYKFEDLCRQLFAYEFLSDNNEKHYIHSEPNNPGLESEPIYDERSQRWIGYQVKYFKNQVDYSQIQHSAEEIVKYYKGKVDCVYIFCNKSVTTTCRSYRTIRETLKNAGIVDELITDTTILDMVRKYPNLGLYYFEQHFLSHEWFEKHMENICGKIGERYNNAFNVETKNELRLSLFIQDRDAVAYINNKKKEALKELKYLGWKYDEFDEYIRLLRKIVQKIPDITIENVMESEKWHDIIQDAICDKVEIFRQEMETLDKKKTKIDISIQMENDESEKKKSWEEKRKIYERQEIYKKLIEMSNILDLSEEMKLIKSDIMVLEGNAGTGKTHLLANKADKLLKNNQKVLMLIGGDYLSDNAITEQIASELSLKYSFYDMLDILNTEGERTGHIVPVFIDALNESWNEVLWKSAMPVLFNKIRSCRYVKMVVSFRTEYQHVLLDDNEMEKEGVYKIIHQGFAEESFSATKEFLNHYGIAFSPIHMFNHAITNPLFLTLYCKTYQGDEVEWSALYKRLLKIANMNMHKNMAIALRRAGYDASDDVVTPVILSLADFINSTGKKYFTKDEISTMPIWQTSGISLRPFIRNLIKENILHEYMYHDEERIYFAYDQMNDYFCAKALLAQFREKERLIEYIKENVLEIKDTGTVNYPNAGLFVCLCALFAERYNEECVHIIDDIKDENDREWIFNKYVDSFQWRNSCNISVERFVDMCGKYNVKLENLWDLFITNSVKQSSKFNSSTLHKVLMSYRLNERDYLWTIYINDIWQNSENRLVQVVQLYCEGSGLETTTDSQKKLLLILFGWLLTSSDRRLRDYTSKAMVEVLKYNFNMAEYLLRKFEMVNDPYVIQRLYGIVWGACVKRENKDKTVYQSLVEYVYKNIFCSKKVYPDILLRDYARLIIERYTYEYPGEKIIEEKIIMPPYVSDPIPDIGDQEYRNNHYEKGMSQLINSMRFEGSGWYGDFGRYIFQRALRDFDVNHDMIFDYAIFYIINELGYSNELFGEYDSNLGRYNCNRYTTAKLERIGKKYQWIAMYNILARVADHCTKRDRGGKTKYEGPWEPNVRDFDASLNESFITNHDMPVFNESQVEEQDFEKKNMKVLDAERDINAWLNDYSEFFDIQKSKLILKDSTEKEWVILSKYSDSRNLLDGNLLVWNWIYGYFVTKEQYKILEQYKNQKEQIVNEDIAWIPETYTVYFREYPWAKGCENIKQLSYIPLSIKTGEKKSVTETYSVPDYSELDAILEKYTSCIEANNIAEPIDMPKVDVHMKEEAIIREVSIEKNIGDMMSASVQLRWEEEFDASKEDGIGLYMPCAEFIEKMNLQYGKCDGAFYDKAGGLAAFDMEVIGKKSGLVVRKEIFDTFLKENDYAFIWYVNAGKEIHGEDHSIEDCSDWTGIYYYELPVYFK